MDRVEKSERISLDDIHLETDVVVLAHSMVNKQTVYEYKRKNSQTNEFSSDINKIGAAAVDRYWKEIAIQFSVNSPRSMFKKLSSFTLPEKYKYESLGQHINDLEDLPQEPKTLLALHNRLEIFNISRENTEDYKMQFRNKENDEFTTIMATDHIDREHILCLNQLLVDVVKPKK